VPLLRFPIFEENSRRRQSRNRCLDVLQRDPKKFLPEIRHVDPLLGEFLVERRFKRGRGITVNHRMGVEC